ncbi:hypothetical protein BZF66_05515 [Salmonella enterica]|uniref:hypothetical protein n=1 Tax=Salmonella enterica TaxID=28901 RepID=UPI00127818DB|nr:hypothetical protein [Salmonella enterica]ECC6867541.1 hypothetical protein [Salmonella enterica]ECV9083883.1 hypothetical protein [Salmonella enterica subsp. enterica serovar Infantis]EME3782915.1 hypothetical protein [Salmonella enterica]MCP0435520.1 hypothetical protein [Salmonella enterica subsp. enterica serovar Mbandaka]
MILSCIAILILFCVILSWTDLHSHVGYAFYVAKNEGWHLFPIVWFQSFFLPTAFLRSGKSAFDYTELSKLERTLRAYFSNEEGIEAEWESRRGRYFEISRKGFKGIRFHIPKDDSVSINGYDRLVPPRLAFLMLACAKQIVNEHKKKKNTSEKPLFS